MSLLGTQNSGGPSTVAAVRNAFHHVDSIPTPNDEGRINITHQFYMNDFSLQNAFRYAFSTEIVRTVFFVRGPLPPTPVSLECLERRSVQGFARMGK